MGDVVHALPVASAIRAAWPQTHLTWVCDERWAPLLEGNPAISKIHTFPRRDFRGVGGFLRARHWYRDLREIGADTALDLQGLLRSGLMARSSGAQRTFGLSDAREGAGFFHTDRIPVPKNEHAVLRCLRCLPAMEIPVPGKLEWPLPAHPLPESFPAGEPFLALHPTSRGAGKSLDAASLAAFAETFQKNCRAKIALLGAEGGPPIGGAIDLRGKTSLGELTALLRAARFVVSVDSGPMHIAAALGTPLLSIHTWSDPRLVGPFSENAWIWQGGGIRKQNIAEAPPPEKPFTPDSARAVAEFAAARF
jgi:ADP-heptose:LPS heptosyltransferase